MSAIMILGRFNDDKINSWDEEFEYPKKTDHELVGVISKDFYCNIKRTKNRSSIQNLNKFPWKSFVDEYKQVVKYVTFDIIAYNQGWFFTRQFFNRDDTIIFCTTKRGMINTMQKYLDFGYRGDIYNKGEIISVYNEFVSKWEDGMFFEMSW